MLIPVLDCLSGTLYGRTMRALPVLIALLFGLSSVSDAALLCWKDQTTLRCDITPDDWDAETERHYMEEREALASAVAKSLPLHGPASDPMTAGSSASPLNGAPPARYYDCHVAEVTSDGIPAVTCTP